MSRARRNPVTDLEAAVADLTARRTALAGQLAEAQAANEAAQRQRRALLLREKPADAGELAEADQACRQQEGRKAGLEDALRELGARLEDAAQQLADERERAEREAKARQYETSADQIEALAGRLGALMADAAAVVQEIAGNVPPDACLTRTAEFVHGIQQGRDEAIAGNDIALAILADALHSAVPQTFEIRSASGQLAGTLAFEQALVRWIAVAGRPARYGWAISEFEPVDAATAARVFASEPLRERAKAIRESKPALTEPAATQAQVAA